MKKIIFVVYIILSFSGKAFSQDSSLAVPKDTVRLKLHYNNDIDTSRFNVFPKKYSGKKIALVLSGGGARGIAQLGVMNELEKHNIRVDMVVGTSIGALLGGLYSSGYKVDEIRNILNRFNWNKALSLTNKYQRTSLFPEQRKVQDRSLITIPLDGIKPIILPSSFSNGLYLSEKINSFILNSRYHPKRNFSDLKIPFAAVATNLDNGEKVVLSKGNLSESIKASLTFPLLYTPISIDGKNLVDGGLAANIPNDVAKTLGADLTIVVNSTSNLRSNEELDDPLNIADQILSIAMSQLNDLQLKDAGIVITPDINDHSSLDYSRINYLILKGETKTAQSIDLIKSKIDSLELSESSYFNYFITNPEVTFNTDYTDPILFDSIKKLSDNYFEKYTAIEKNLKLIYNTGLFDNPFAVVSRTGSISEISYELKANPVLERITVENVISPLDSLIRAFKLNNLNRVINVFECFRFYDDLLGKLRDHSYSLVDIDRFYFNHNTKTLELSFTRGTVDSVEISGNYVTNDNVITREISFNIENPINKRNVDNSIKNVMSTNLFQQVSFDYDYAENLYLPDLKIKLVEKNTLALRFSLRADNERKLQVLLDLRSENIFGTAIETGLLAAGGARNQIYQFDIQSSQFFSLPLTFNYNVYYGFKDIYRYEQVIDSTENKYNVINVGDYSNIRYGMSFLLGTQLQRYGTMYGQIFYEQQEIQNIVNSRNLVEDLRVIKLKFGGTFDTEDKVPFPNNGILLNFYYETAKNTLQGEQSFTKLYISYDQYFTIAKSQTLRPRFIFGFGDKTTPLTEQFSMGGEKSFFGMVDDELRGRQILETSLEYRYMFPYKLFFDTYFSIRYDLGNVWQVTEDIRFKDLRHGIGVSASFDTPVGQTSFSVGRSFLIKGGLTEDSFIFGPYDFYFSIGYDI